MKKWSNLIQIKEQDKTSEKILNKMELSDLLDKKLKVMVIKIITKLKEEWTQWEHHKEKENIRKYQQPGSGTIYSKGRK